MFDFQKEEIRRRANSRIIAPGLEIVFGAMLAAVSLFIAVLMFGAGSFLGGLLFTVPVVAGAIGLRNVARARREDDEAPSPDDDTEDPRWRRL